eukprot:SAG25_NODE_2148_length_1894_cov_1.398886_1_plen_493_part_01
MGDLAAWLGAIHTTCAALVGPLDDDYGVETVEDLRLLEPEDIEALADTLKRVPAKKFRAALEVLAIDAALPGDPAGAGPKSIPEAVPPEKPGGTNLHTVGVAHDDAADACAPEPELLPSASASAATSPKPNMFSNGKGFGSMRFDGVVPAHAQELKQGMNDLDADMNIINMTGGGDIDLAVQQGILEADAFIVFGSAKYGEDTGNAACTYFESKFAQSRGKKIILIRMIPFDEEFEFPQAKFMFGLNMLELPWMLGTPMPPDLPRQVVEAIGLIPSPPARQPTMEPEPMLAPPITTTAQLAVATGLTEQALLRFTRADLLELCQQQKVEVVHRNAIADQAAAQAAMAGAAEAEVAAQAEQAQVDALEAAKAEVEMARAAAAQAEEQRKREVAAAQQTAAEALQAVERAARKEPLAGACEVPASQAPKWVDGQYFDPRALAVQRARVKVDGHGEGVVQAFNKSTFCATLLCLVFACQRCVLTVLCWPAFLAAAL